MLRNPLYMGWLKSVDLLVRGVHPPIVSQELFDAVQGVLTGRSETAQSRKVLNADFPPHELRLANQTGNIAPCAYREISAKFDHRMTRLERKSRRPLLDMLGAGVQAQG
jgi:Recombinase